MWSNFFRSSASATRGVAFDDRDFVLVEQLADDAASCTRLECGVISDGLIITQLPAAIGGDERAERQVDREVPRRDDQHHALRLVDDAQAREPNSASGVATRCGRIQRRSGGSRAAPR